jgi:hypothetical protein
MGRTQFTPAVADDTDVNMRHARREDRRQSAGHACQPFHGNPLPLNGMRFYSAMWQEFENFRALSDHSRAADRREKAAEPGGLVCNRFAWAGAQNAKGPDVRSWHKADIPTPSIDVRSWG